MIVLKLIAIEQRRKDHDHHLFMYETFKKELDKRIAKIVEEQDNKVLLCNQGIRKVSVNSCKCLARC